MSKKSPAQRDRMAAKAEVIELDLEKHRELVEERIHHLYTSGVD